jgi:serine/threonine protein kinase
MKDPKWKIIGDRIGDASTFGQAYMGCLVKGGEEECNYVIKIMNIDKASPNTIDYIGTYSINKLNMEAVMNEVNIQIKASKFKLAPKIHDVFFCKSFAKDEYNENIEIKTVPEKELRQSFTMKEVNGKKYPYFEHAGYQPVLAYNCKVNKKDSTKDPMRDHIKHPKLICYVPTRMVYIVMDSLSITVANLRQAFGNVYDNFINEKVYDLFRRLHEIGIFHGDAHKSNIMFKLSKRGKEVYTERLVQIREGRIDYPGRIDKNDIKGDFYGSLDSLMFIDFGKGVDFNEGIKITELMKAEDRRRYIDD